MLGSLTMKMIWKFFELVFGAGLLGSFSQESFRSGLIQVSFSRKSSGSLVRGFLPGKFVPGFLPAASRPVSIGRVVLGALRTRAHAAQDSSKFSLTYLMRCSMMYSVITGPAVRETFRAAAGRFNIWARETSWWLFRPVPRTEVRALSLRGAALGPASVPRPPKRHLESSPRSPGLIGWAPSPSRVR